VPAVLVETGFMTNPTESHRLKTGSYQQRIALGLVRGISAFLAG
jgi:N-acetylmuramoyl-L-alanine amidase